MSAIPKELGQALSEIMKEERMEQLLEVAQHAPGAVGVLVIAQRDTAICKQGELGVVYDTHGADAVSVIFENGGYDGFSQSERDDFLIMLPLQSDDLEEYRFKSVMRLTADYEKGVFDEAFVVGRKFCTLFQSGVFVAPTEIKDNKLEKNDE